MTDEHNPPTFRVQWSSAFRTNSVGLAGHGFPFAAEVFERDGVYGIGGAAARVCDLVDVIEAFAQPVVTVQSLGHYWFDQEGRREWTPGEIAREQGVEAEAHDVTWAGHNELLVLRRSDLGPFLAELYPYNIDVVDAPGPVAAAAADEMALAVGTRGLDTCVLHELPDAELHFSGHDDCYFHIESRDPVLPVRVFARLLTLAAGAALLARAETSTETSSEPSTEPSVEPRTEAVTVVEPDAEFVRAILARSGHWSGPVRAPEPDGTVRLDLAADKWRLGKRLPPQADLSACYDPTRGRWHLVESEPEFEAEPDAEPGFGSAPAPTSTTGPDSAR
ncbi:hypothetical protein [Embleya sp. NPDC005575]|uniref:hypothetical protein n=1 Tax=Embleya sp. NPDC005575 TaxID=3156892 RepID=UPI0033BE38D7